MIHSIRQTGGVRPAEANRTLIYRSSEYSFEIHTYVLLYSKSSPSHAGFAYYVLSNTAVVGSWGYRMMYVVHMASYVGESKTLLSVCTVLHAQ